MYLTLENYGFCMLGHIQLTIFYFSNGRYIDCLSLTYATNKGKMLKLYYEFKRK